MPLTYTTAATEGVRNAFGALVGRGRDWDYEALSAATTINLRRLYRFANAEAKPSWQEMLMLADKLGAEFLNIASEPIGLGGMTRTKTEVNQYDLPIIATEFTMLWTRQSADNVYCPGDWARERPVVRQLHMAAGARLRHTV